MIGISNHKLTKIVLTLLLAVNSFSVLSQNESAEKEKILAAWKYIYERDQGNLRFIFRSYAYSCRKCGRSASVNNLMMNVISLVLVAVATFKLTGTLERDSKWLWTVFVASLVVYLLRDVVQRVRYRRVE